MLKCRQEMALLELAGLSAEPTDAKETNQYGQPMKTVWFLNKKRGRWRVGAAVKLMQETCAGLYLPLGSFYSWVSCLALQPQPEKHRKGSSNAPFWYSFSYCEDYFFWVAQIFSPVRQSCLTPALACFHPNEGLLTYSLYLLLSVNKYS